MKTIHVPQGRTARLNAQSLSLDINSLFTRGFLMCNILVLWSQDGQKVSLSHIDPVTAIYQGKVIAKELKWVGQNYDFQVYRREAGRFVTQVMGQYVPNIERGVQELGKQPTVQKPGLDAVLVEMRENQVPSVTLQESTYKPDSLFVHPYEERFLAVHKIEQAVCNCDSIRASKNTVIFDGEAWQPIPKKELKPQCLTSYSKKYFKLVCNNDLCFREAHFSKDAREHSKLIKERMTDMMAVSLLQEMRMNMVAECGLFLAGEGNVMENEECGVPLVSYLNDFNPEAILRHEIKVLAVDPQVTNAIRTHQDKIIQSQLKQISAKQELETPILAVIRRCKEGVSGEYADFLAGELDRILHRYHRRQFWNNHRPAFEEARSEFEKCYRIGLQALLVTKDYGEAMTQFQQALPLASICLIQNDTLMTQIYFNLAQSYHQLGCYKEAIGFYQKSSELRQQYFPMQIEQLKKTDQFILECTQAKEQQAMDQQRKSLRM